MTKQRIDTTLAQASHLLSDSPTPRLDAEILLSHVLNKSCSYFYTWPETHLDNEQIKRFMQLILQRKKGHPIAYITGKCGFWNLDLHVSEETLIPRQDTELLVELVLDPNISPSQNGQQQKQVADLGTGSGAIALSLAKERPDWRVIAIDTNPAALAIAQSNALFHRILNVTFLVGSWCTPLTHNSMDVIVSNPPYIRKNDPHLKKGDVRFEPLSALVSGVDGLDAIRDITRQSLQSLKPGGILLLEHGYDQSHSVQQILCDAGFKQVHTQKDLAGKDRVTHGQKPFSCN